MTSKTRERIEFFRQQVARSEKNASSARSDEMKRAWMICAREWRKMVRDEELKFLAETAPTLVPDADADKPQETNQETKETGQETGQETDKAASKSEQATESEAASTPEGADKPEVANKPDDAGKSEQAD